MYYNKGVPLVQTTAVVGRLIGVRDPIYLHVILHRSWSPIGARDLFNLRRIPCNEVSNAGPDHPKPISYHAVSNSNEKDLCIPI